MSRIPLPSEDDYDAYIIVDHREYELAIATGVAERLSPEHTLTAKETDDTILLGFQGQEFAVPLQFTPHDRYIMISSLAHLLREHYRFFLLESRLEDDTHYVLVADEASVNAWGALPGHLVPLELGYDYFHGIHVPYLGGEDSAPDFEQDRQNVRDASEAMSGFIEAILTGSLSDEAAAKLAALATEEPDENGVVEKRSQAEISAEIQKAFQAALDDPEVAGSLKELDDAMSELKSLVGGTEKP